MSNFLNEKLLYFYDHSKRVLPWRNNKNPYYIWISEIMLQQTRVEAVIPYFNRFIESLPTVYDLANVEMDRLLKLWEGLGYYSRARNLQIAAKDIVENFNGLVPKTKKELESLKGIGPYTSGAILSIAYEKRVAAVDGNVLRVFSRYYGIKEDIKDVKTKKVIHQLVYDSLPTYRNGDYNQAIMELGATLCRPNGKPLCEECPIKEKCFAYNNELQSLIPFQSKKTKRKSERKTIIVMEYDNQFAVVKRPDHGLLASLYEFIVLDDEYSIEEISKQYKGTITEIGDSKHLFTHKIWHMKGYHVLLEEIEEGYQFVSLEDILSKYSIPNAYKKYKNFIINK